MEADAGAQAHALHRRQRLDRDMHARGGDGGGIRAGEDRHHLVADFLDHLAAREPRGIAESADALRDCPRRSRVARGLVELRAAAHVGE